MDARINVVTLGVRDLARSRRFYCEGLRFHASSAGNDDVVFIDAGGVVLALFSRKALAEDAGLTDDDDAAAHARHRFSGVTISQNVAAKADVDRVLAEAVAAGAKLLQSGHEAFWGGYTGYFADPDGFRWEVAYNPGEIGQSVLP